MSELAHPETPRLAELASLVADKFGIELSRYSRTSVNLVLDALDRVSPEDAEARIRLLIGTFSIGETCFMRHAEHFDALRGLVRSIPAMQRGTPLRIWSAGCATGEEPYSLLAVLEKELGPYPVEVFGSDVNPEFISHARGGRYRSWSLRGVDRQQVADWLDVHDEGATVAPALVERVGFQEQNLVCDAFASRLHVVFCRNVLLYFRPAAARAVLARMAHAVEPGGLLFLGYSDPAPATDGLWVQESFKGVRYFRRAFHPSLGAVSPASGVKPRPSGLAEEPRRADIPAPQIQVAPDTTFDVDGYVLSAVLADETGDHRRMLAAARRASLLAPDAAFPHFLLARAFTALSEPRRAAAHAELARRCLLSVAHDQGPLAYAQGLTALQLTRMIDAAYGR